MVVKAESEHGRRLHIDKEMLRHWREDFARMMREQGRDPARDRLIATRKAVVSAWMSTAEQLEAQGEVELGREVRYFARHLPPVSTDRVHAISIHIQL